MNNPNKPDSTKEERPRRDNQSRENDGPSLVRDNQSRRLAFLLRMWCVDDAGRANWQASLEMPETGKRIGFASLEQLFMYLIDLSENGNDQEDQE